MRQKKRSKLSKHVLVVSTGFLYLECVNPYHAELNKWNNPPSIFGTVHFHFKGY